MLGQLTGKLGIIGISLLDWVLQNLNSVFRDEKSM